MTDNAYAPKPWRATFKPDGTVIISSTGLMSQIICTADFRARNDLHLAVAAPQMLKALRAVDKAIYEDERLAGTELGELQDTVVDAIAAAVGPCSTRTNATAVTG